jgi:hypothetical protein
MSNAGKFIGEFQREHRAGNISSATEHHVRQAFNKIGWHGSE